MMTAQWVNHIKGFPLHCDGWVTYEQGIWVESLYTSVGYHSKELDFIFIKRVLKHTDIRNILEVLLSTHPPKYVAVFI